MAIWVAIKAFFKALRSPTSAKEWMQGADKSVESKKTKEEPKVDPSHLRPLRLMQENGRLIDFLKEDIQPFSDAQVGAAVRKIHSDCGKMLEEMVTVRPVFEEAEGAVIQVPRGYDPSEIKVVGNVQGEPPFSGKLVHKGWRAAKRSLPKHVGELNEEVIVPAEVELTK